MPSFCIFTCIGIYRFTCSDFSLQGNECSCSRALQQGTFGVRKGLKCVAHAVSLTPYTDCPDFLITPRSQKHKQNKKKLLGVNNWAHKRRLVGQRTVTG